MAYVIAEPRIGVKDTACVDACPVDCIHPRNDEPEYQTAEMLHIYPEDCIDCGAGVLICDLLRCRTAGEWRHFAERNAACYQKAVAAHPASNL